MWFQESYRYFCKIENFANGEINERNFSNPHPWFLGMYSSLCNSFEYRSPVDEISCSDLTSRQGTRIILTVMATRVTCPIAVSRTTCYVFPLTSKCKVSWWRTSVSISSTLLQFYQTLLGNQEKISAIWKVTKSMTRTRFSFWQHLIRFEMLKQPWYNGCQPNNL